MKLTDIVQTEYETIENKEIKTPKKAGVNRNVSRLLHCIKTYLSSDTTYSNTLLNGSGEKRFIKEIQRIDYTAQDITTLCFALETLTDHRLFSSSGWVISALVNEHYSRTKQKESYTLMFEHIPPLDAICYRLDGASVDIFGGVNDLFAKKMIKGTINLHGSAKDEACSYMMGGSVTIEGSIKDSGCKNMINGNVHIKGCAKSFLGEDMLQGTIFVDGNTENYCGRRMDNGYILVRGNTGDYLGRSMKRGVIVVCGNAGPFAGSNMLSGTLVIKGKNGNFLGEYLDKGIIIAEGSCGESVGYMGNFGKIIIDEMYESIDECRGDVKIIYKGEKVRESERRKVY